MGNTAERYRGGVVAVGFSRMFCWTEVFPVSHGKSAVELCADRTRTVLQFLGHSDRVDPLKEVHDLLSSCLIAGTWPGTMCAVNTDHTRLPRCRSRSNPSMARAPGRSVTVNGSRSAVRTTWFSPETQIVAASCLTVLNLFSTWRDASAFALVSCI